MRRTRPGHLSSLKKRSLSRWIAGQGLFRLLREASRRLSTVPVLSCKKVAERASALIDSELGVFDLLQMRLHLALCKGCDAFVRQMRITRDLTKTAAALDDQPADAVDGPVSEIFAQLHNGKETGP